MSATWNDGRAKLEITIPAKWAGQYTRHAYCRGFIAGIDGHDATTDNNPYRGKGQGERYYAWFAGYRIGEKRRVAKKYRLSIKLGKKIK